MTKSTKQLFGLVGALAVLGGAYGGIVLINQHNSDKEAEQSKADKEANTFYLSQIEEPVSISYTNSYGTFSFTYDEENETWKYDGDEHFPVTQSYLTTLSGDMKALTAERKLEEIQDDLSVYGLDEPSCSITAKGADDTQVTVQIGSVNSYSSDYYAKVEGADEIYTISSDYISDISNDLSALQEKESFPTITSPSVTSACLVKDNISIQMDKEVTMEEATPEEASTDRTAEESEDETVEMVEVTRWVFTQSEGSSEKTNRVDEDDDIHTLLVNMIGLTFEDCADYYADEEEKEQYGLTDAAAVLTLIYTSAGEEQTLTLTIGNTTEDEEYYYVSMNDSDEVNTISKESLDTVFESFSNYSL